MPPSSPWRRRSASTDGAATKRTSICARIATVCWGRTDGRAEHRRADGAGSGRGSGAGLCEVSPRRRVPFLGGAVSAQRRHGRQGHPARDAPGEEPAGHRLAASGAIVSERAVLSGGLSSPPAGALGTGGDNVGAQVGTHHLSLGDERRGLRRGASSPASGSASANAPRPIYERGPAATALPSSRSKLRPNGLSERVC